MGFAGVYPSLSSSHVAQGQLVHYPVHWCIYQGDKKVPFEGYCSRLVLLLESSCSWLTGRKEDVGQIWTDFSTLGNQAMEWWCISNLGAATNVMPNAKTVLKLHRSLELLSIWNTFLFCDGSVNVCLHIQKAPSFLQTTVFVEQQSAEYPSQRLYLCCKAGCIPAEGEFQGLIMSTAHTKAICLVLLFKIVWKYPFVIPFLFILVISRLEFNVQRFTSITILHHCRSWSHKIC